MRLIVDYRERKSGLIELLKDSFEIEIGNLPCGDYLINERVLVERKTARDFLISIIDLRLFRQAHRLQDNPLKSILLIEGDPFQTDLDFTPEVIRGTLLSLAAIWQLPVIFSTTKEETRDILITISQQDTKNCDVLLLRGGYRPRRLRTRQLYLLQGLPGIGPVLARRLLEHCGTPVDVMKASEEELAAVKGINTGKARTIRDVLDN